MYGLITSAIDADGLSIGFDRDRKRRQRELTNSRNQKGKYHVRIMLKDIFGFEEHLEKATFGLGYNLTLTTNNDNSILKKADAINLVKYKINSIDWYAPHYIPSITQKTILSKQILSEVPTKLQKVERSVFVKEVNSQNLCTFELGFQEGLNVPKFNIISFQQSDRQDSQILSNDTFYRPAVTSAQCVIARPKYLDSAILINYDDSGYSQGYGQIKDAFILMKKDDLLQPYVSEQIFRLPKC